MRSKSQLLRASTDQSPRAGSNQRRFFSFPGGTRLDTHVFKNDGTSVFAMSEKQANYLRPSTEDIQTNGLPDIGSPLRVE